MRLISGSVPKGVGLFSEVMSNRPKIALWFRYGPAEHTELFHAMPDIVAMLARHADVHYFGMKSSRSVPDRILKNAVIHELPFRVDRSSARDKMLKTLLWLVFLPGIALYCRWHRIHAVYIDETIPLSVLIARLFYGRRVAITVADFFTDIYFTGSKAFIGNALRAVDLWSWRRIPLIFTRAHATRRWLAGKGVDPANVHPVYDPCDFEIYHALSADERAECRARLGYKPENMVLVHHGILHPNKGNDRIIRALAELRGVFPHLRYLLIGDGTEMPRLQALVRELKMEAVCTLTGWLPSLTDVNRALNAGDIGLVMRTGATSDDFHMTGALVHNMACGLPILAARLGGVSEVVKEETNGLLFDPADMTEFKEKLIRLMQDPKCRTQFGGAAETAARIHFDMRSVAEKTVLPLYALAGIKSFPMAVILLGGKGTRIQSLFSDRPKCLVPVAGKPFLLWQLEWLRRCGFHRIHLAAGYMADVLRDWVATNAPADMEITVSVESEALGTGGAIRFVEPWIRSEPFFVLNGDSLAPNLDFEAMLTTHSATPQALVTIGVAPINRTGRYGTVEFDGTNRVTAFLEKQDREPGWINTGVYCISRKLLERIEPGRNVSIETAVFPALASEQALYVQQVAPPLLDMGTPDGLQEMTRWLESAKS